MNLNTRPQQPNLSISIGISGSPKIVDSEQTSPFHQRKAFNVFPIPDAFNFSKQLNTNIYNSQNSDNRIAQPMQNGRISPMNAPYPANSFYKPMSYHTQSIYQPKIQSQSPKQYENVLSPTFQPSNKLTIVEKKEEPVEVKKRKKGRPRKKTNSPSTSPSLSTPPPPTTTTTTINSNSNRVNEIISKFGLLSSTATSPIQPEGTIITTTTTTTAIESPIATQLKPKPKSRSRSSRSRKKLSTKRTSNNNNNNNNNNNSNSKNSIKSRIIYPDFDMKSLFNDNDYYDYQFMTFSLKDKKIKNYKTIKLLKENRISNDIENDEILSMKDVLLPSEVISDIKFPKRKLEFVLISDSDTENENEEKRESKNREDGKDNEKHINKKRKLEDSDIKVKMEKEVVENNVGNETVVNNNGNRNVQEKNGSEKENRVENEPVTAFYTYYERFLEDYKNGKLMSL